MFFVYPETLNNNIENSAKIFNIEKEKMLSAALNNPALFLQKSETLYNNVINSAKIFNVEKETFLEKALNQPNLFSFKPETLYEKEKIKEFYKLLMGQNYTLLSGKTINTTGNDVLFKSILNYLVKKFYDIKLNHSCDAVKILQKNKKRFNVTLPEHEIAIPFEKFVKEFFNKKVKHNHYKILIK